MDRVELSWWLCGDQGLMHTALLLVAALRKWCRLSGKQSRGPSAVLV